MNWRPHNETVGDLAREKAAGERIESAWGVRCLKLSEALYGVDWAFSRGSALVGWGEYKHRAKQYDTLILSAAKWLKGCALARESGRPFILFVDWPEGLYWFGHTDHPVEGIAISGNNRGQNGDIEPVVHLPTAAFRRLSGPVI
jgi:hypothetical protein